MIRPRWSIYGRVGGCLEAKACGVNGCQAESVTETLQVGPCIASIHGSGVLYLVVH